MRSMEHENIVRFSDKKSGLKVIVAFHKPLNNLSMGGTRLLPYASEDEALADVLRLSEGMTYKAACAGVPAGGAKGAIIAHPSQKNESILARYANFVDGMKGEFVTGQDINISLDDVRFMADHTPHIVGIRSSKKGPSWMTALGVFEGLRSAAQVKFGSASLAGLKVGIQGVGDVGTHLANMLVEANAELTVADIDEQKAKKVAQHTGARMVAAADVLFEDVDILSPCARGGILNVESIPRIKASIICGAANNQLANPQTDARALKDRNILYCPDFVVSAGGVIEAYSEYRGYDQTASETLIRTIGKTTRIVLRSSEDEDICTYQAALKLSHQRRQDLETQQLHLSLDQLDYRRTKNTASSLTLS